VKIVSFSRSGQPGFAVVSADEQSAVDATDRFVSLRQVLENQQLEALQDWSSSRDPDIALIDVTFLPPVPNARRFVCIGVNFEKVHPVHGVMPQPEHVSLFTKMEGSVVGHGAPLLRPENTDSFDYEGEITLVIGKTASRVRAADAENIIAGVTILNDGSVRDWQKHSVAAGKNFREASSCGPWMVTLDELGELDNLHMTTFLNGEKVQDVRASEMIFGIRQLIEYVTEFITLEAGDILSTGSPERLKLTHRESQYLQTGDTVDIAIDGVGTLTNTVVSRQW